MTSLTPLNLRVACFISPHGFGHAARAAAIMTAVQERIPATHFEIFTRVPAWFFSESFAGSFHYNDVISDIGLVQRTPMTEDLAGTLDKLMDFLPLREGIVNELSDHLHETGCQLAICDISPLGIAAAYHAGIPSILVENFTWDWIYEGYLSQAPDFKTLIPLLRELFNLATYHIQTEPVCLHSPRANLLTHPVSRKPRTRPSQIRKRLKVPEDKPMLLITMGGIPGFNELPKLLLTRPEYTFVIPGASDRITSQGNLILLPQYSGFYHPDLIHSADVVIGKAGYSTVSEVYSAGSPFGYICRPGFRESGALSAFIQREMSGIEIGLADFKNGTWLDHLPDLLALPRQHRPAPNGSDQVAEFVHSIITQSM